MREATVGFKWVAKKEEVFDSQMVDRWLVFLNAAEEPVENEAILATLNDEVDDAD
jgi:hypothetical protein